MKPNQLINTPNSKEHTMNMLNWVILAALPFFTVLAPAANNPWGLEQGNPEWTSAGPLTFGPSGILFIGDTAASAVIALATEDKNKPANTPVNLAGLDGQLTALLGAPATVQDLAVNPDSGQIYLSCMSGGKPALVKVSDQGNLQRINLEGVMHSRVQLKDPPTGERRGRSRRDDSITDLAFADGKVLVAGLTDRESPSTVHEITFPFEEADTGSSLEIFHGAHGKYEDYSAIRTFIPLTIDGEPSLLAGFVCTPLVKVPLQGLKAGAKVRGTTVAELGNRNRPLDMIVYEQDGKRFLLMANSARGVMKISTENLERDEGITERVSGGGIAGQSYETIESLEGVVQLDKLNDTHAVVLVKNGDTHDLRTIVLP